MVNGGAVKLRAHWRVIPLTSFLMSHLLVLTLLRSDIRDLVRHLTDRGIGVLITDHNVRETLEMIDRAYIIHDGKVLTEGTPQEIVSNDDVRRVYLGDMFG